MPDGHTYKGSRQTLHERRRQIDKETAGSFSDDDSPRIYKKHSGIRHHGSSNRPATIQSGEELPSLEQRYERGSRPSGSGRDPRARHSEKSNSGGQDLSDSSNRHSREKKRHHHGISLKKESEKGGHNASDIGRKSDHRSWKEVADDEKVIADHRRCHSRHHNHSESSLEPNFCSERRQQHKEKEAGHSSRSSKQRPRSKDDRVGHERWEMVEGLDDDYRGVNSHKHRRMR